MARQPCILVAVDFSEASAAAWRMAKDLAETQDARIVLVHAFSPPIRAPSLAASVRAGPYVPILEAETEMQYDEAHRLTERWAQPLRAEGLDVEIVASPGMPSDVILEAAKTCDPSCIVLGRQGQGRLRRAMFGSQSRQVCEHSKWPVLLVPF